MNFKTNFEQLHLSGSFNKHCCQHRYKYKATFNSSL